jgi:hypothetical protein
MAKAGFRSKGAWVPTESVRAALPIPLPEMVLPTHVEAWRELDDGLAAQLGFLQQSLDNTEIESSRGYVKV